MKPVPFRITIPDEAISDLKERLARTRWPDQLEDAGWDSGVDISYLRALVDYWQKSFDWRTQEARLNHLSQFTADIDGHRIHFVHERARRDRGIPLILTHGWPGSFIEMEKILPLLTDPQTHGAPEAPAFDVVVPSLPGYGFSSRPTREGVHPAAIADLWAKLMAGLGYERFGAQGGDWGAGVTLQLGRRHADRMLGIHFNLIPNGLVRRSQANISEEEKRTFEKGLKWSEDEGAYAHVHRTKPQTLAYALNDSPVGLAAWIVEKFRSWSDCGGDIERAFTRDEILTNISIYWYTQTISSSMRLYREARLAPPRLAPGESIDVPSAFANFPTELWLPPRSYVERAFSNVRRWTVLPTGGHFAAMEQPQLLAAELRAFFGGVLGKA
jgi:pimeloyl-ACP methyl ester carboxylesterase